jgi:putative sterol carrier protein
MGGVVSDFSIQELMDQLPAAFLPEKAGGINAVIQFNLSGPGGGDWIMTIQDQTCKVETGITANPRVKLEATAQDCLDIFNGKLNPMRAFMKGRLRLRGDSSLAMKLIRLFKTL